IVINSSRDYSGRNGAFNGILSITRAGTYAGSVNIGPANQPEMIVVNGKTKTKQLQIYNEIPSGSPTVGTGYILQSNDEIGNAVWVPQESIDEATGQKVAIIFTGLLEMLALERIPLRKHWM
ncbi:MAG: hypothetical protein WC341_15160, partial [Bacteroidales bacterium]